MELWSSLSRRRPTNAPPLLLLVVLICALVVLMPTGVSATRYQVGGRYGWTTNVNYTEWAKQQHYYLGDWLFFVYDRNQMNVLEVNKTDYESCNSDHPLHNWTTGAGRDVVPLNVTKHYYFISGKGFCYGGMKLAVLVENPPPPPKASPSTHKNGAPSGGAIGLLVVQVALAFAVIWALLSSF